jgi:hypothetical protein
MRLSFKRNIFFVLTLWLLSHVAGYAQVQRSGKMKKLTWQAPQEVAAEDGTFRKIAGFGEAVYLSEFNYVPAVYLIEQGTVQKVELTNTEYHPLTPAEQASLPVASLKSSPEILISHDVSQHRQVSKINIVPLRLNSATGVAEKLVSFTYNLIMGSSPATMGGPGQIAPYNHRNYASSSVMAQGDWFKVGVTRSGIYKINVAFLNSLGLNAAGVNARHLAVYGNGGGMLPQANSTDRPDDLVENAIYVEGEADGQFNGSDYILFYAHGPDTWTYDAAQSAFLHQKNIYSDTAYYFITVKNTPGLRVQTQAAPTGAQATIAEFDERAHHEQEVFNLLRSGRQWFGEMFDAAQAERTVPFEATGLVPGTKVRLTANVMSTGQGRETSLAIRLNSNQAGVLNFPSIGAGYYDSKGVIRTGSYLLDAPALAQGRRLDVSMAYNRNGLTAAKAYLNFITLQYKRSLELYGGQTSFRSVTALNGTYEYRFARAESELMVWDVSTLALPVNQVLQNSGSQPTFRAISNSQPREFIAFKPSSPELPAPVAAGKVANQDLHALGSQVPDLLIVTAPQFRAQAEKLANFRREHDGLTVVVATTSQIYNEFSSGAQDLTAIRDFAKMLYDKGGDRFKYLLLFGGCSYDYKNRLPNNTNFVPIYQTPESLHPINSFPSDDYVGFLEDSKGTWANNQADLMDVGVGRLPVRTAQEAEQMVAKLMHYSGRTSALGKWRNRVVFVADDGDYNLHQRDADDLASLFRQPFLAAYNVNKIYLDAFQQVPSPAGNRSPQASQALNQSVQDGALFVNYTGHGNTEQWTSASLIEPQMIQNWNNLDNLPFFVTATCDFGVYDKPEIFSGGQLILMSPNGGGIGLITAARAVYSNTNKLINASFYESAFIKERGEMPRLGDVSRNTKNKSISGISNRNYALLGDPSMRLAYPGEGAKITHINNKPVEPLKDTIRALDRVTMQGLIELNGTPDTDFNGLVNVTVYDKEATVSTLGFTQTSPVMQFGLRSSILFDGVAKVENGAFAFTFVVPKDISYVFGEGKVSLYATRSNSLTDVHGANQEFIIGGNSLTAVNDNIPPDIQLFMNDESFVFGGFTDPDPMLIARLADSSGINVSTTGIGREITAVLDGNNEDIIILNRYYSADTNDYTKGTVRYGLRGLAPGSHSLTFKAWDTHNNSAESYLEFMVAENAGLALQNVLNYPNPFTSYTTFHFDHNHAGKDLDVQVQIFTISGKLIKTLQTQAFNSPSHVGHPGSASEIVWDGKDDFGDKIGKGIYIYKVNVRSSDGAKAHKLEKLVILN